MLGLCLSVLAGAACHGESTAANLVERRLKAEAVGDVLNCASTEDIRWAAEGPLRFCSVVDSTESIVVVRRADGGEALQFAKRTEYRSSQAALAAYSEARARTIAATGAPDAECVDAAGRRLQARRGELAVRVVLQDSPSVLDESWTIRESPTIDLCEREAIG